jgi:ATP adenylyltransferase
LEHLWAPWRMAYVTGEKSQECIFCAKPQASDDEAWIIYRGERVFVMLNAFPYNTGHLLVAPYRHVADPLALEPQESAELLYGIRVGLECLQTCFTPEGFNIGLNIGQVAGAGVADHLHAHVVPRWGGDTNFMAVTASCRIVPEALDDTYRKLKHAMEQREHGS